MCKPLSAVAAVLAFAATFAPASDFRFSILGDRTGGANPAVYQEVWREIDGLHPDFVINVGDVIEGGDDATAAAEWQAVRTVWQPYGYPRFFTPGNHDIWSQASRRIYEDETGRPAPYSFNFRNAHFIVLDNSSGPVLSAGQMRFLEDDLKANRGRAPKFVFFHEPFWIVPLKLGSGEFPLHSLACKYGVAFVVSGHGHELVSMERDGVKYVEVGSSGASLRRGTDRGEGFEQGWFYQHLLVEVSGSKAQVTIHEVAGPFGRGRSLRLEDWNRKRPKMATVPAS